ncbi:MAG: DUF58 domain-containing protein [Armatimonadetes bacterium]|nr:DUF58 domain-containing protein [Armatimonadota bacterium]
MRRSPLASVARHLAEQWAFRYTTAGKVLATAIIVATSISSASLNSLAYHLLCALCALTFTAYGVGRLMRPRLRVESILPRRAVAGTDVAGSLRLVNPSSWRSAYDVSAGLFGLPESLRQVSTEAMIPELPPEEAARVPITLRPLKRGIYPLPYARGYSSFPLGLFRIEARSTRPSTAHDGALLVYPRFHHVTGIDVPTNSRYQPGGIALSSSVGESMEYIGNREYHPGDSPRHLDHRSWARLGKPVVKEYQEEYYCRVGLVLDTYVPARQAARPEGFPQLEAAISLAASVADALARGEYIIDIFAAGSELHVFRAGRATAHFENVLEILAGVDACRADPFVKVAPALADELASISSVIYVLLDWDSSRERLVRAAVEANCAVKIFLVCDGPTSAPFTPVAAAHSARQYRPETIRRGGIDVL